MIYVIQIGVEVRGLFLVRMMVVVCFGNVFVACQLVRVGVW